jgi:integrase/recombinase XerD
MFNNLKTTTVRTQNTFSTFFLVQSYKAINNEALLYARITVNGKRIDISLKRKIPLHLWDSNKKRDEVIQVKLDKSISI